jgi:hypothetical protein
MLLKNQDRGNDNAETQSARSCRRGTPHPGCFAKRVWICLIPKGLSILATTKSLQEYRSKGVSGIVERYLPSQHTECYHISIWLSRGFWEKLKAEDGKGS